MSQLTIYLDDNTLKKIARAAQSEKSSVSLWVKKQILRAFKSAWPDGYFELLGSLKDADLNEPEELSFSRDVKRQKP